MLYYQIEYCELGSLDMLLLSESLRDNNKEMPILWDFALDILLGIDCLHQSGYVHMDIKPSNIFIYNYNGRRRIKIGDYGTLTEINVPVKEEGDGLYVAPEILSGNILTDTRFDIYSAGITLYEMASNLKITQFIWNKIKEQDYIYLGFDTLSISLQSLLQAMLKPFEERPIANILLNTEQMSKTALNHNITIPKLGDIQISQFPCHNTVNILSACQQQENNITKTTSSAARKLLF